MKLKNLNSIVAHRDVNSISYYYIFEWEYIPPKALTDFFFRIYLGYCKDLLNGEGSHNEGIKKRVGNVCTILSKIFLTSSFPKITGTPNNVLYLSEIKAPNDEVV